MPELKFKGKTIIRSHHLTLPYRQMKPVVSKSRNKKPSLDDNLIIHGDNLLALKSLLPSFAGKIKCIYIDPPYNTGNEKWVYNDNVNSPMHQEWLKKVVDREDLTRHDKWLCMMWPRLVLLRELLREDGVIFVSIDDNEAHRLRAVMDEIFGEENFVALLTWRGMHTVRNSSKDFNKNSEYVIVFAKEKNFLIQEGNTSTYLRYPMDKSESYPYDDKDDKGPYKLDPLYARNFYTPYEFTFKNGVVWSPPSGSYPRYAEETLEEMELANEIDFGGKEPRAKRYLNRVQEGIPPDTFLPVEIVGFNKDGTKEMYEIFGDKVFDQPKPTSLLKFFFRIHRKVDKDNDIILDSFAGSGTTGQAVLALNAEDGGNRKFILIEQEDYADSITAERIRRVMKGVPNAKDEKLQKGYGGSFSYFTLGPALNEDEMLGGKTLPSYLDLARYVFFTATGENLDETQINPDAFYVGESKNYRVWLYYQPDVEFLKNAPLNKDFAQNVLGEWHAGAKTRLVIGSHKFLDDEYLRAQHIEFCQLPFAIYRFRAA